MFLHPLILFALAAAALPALLHLLERRLPPELEFPPLRYLTDAERRSARRLRLRHLLLLLLRTAVIVLVVLAAARPLLPWAVGSAHAPTALAVILDNSPSSGVVVDGRSRLDRLRAVARASLAAAGSADRLWLMLADGVVRAGSQAELLAAVESAGASPWRLDLSDAVTRATRLVATVPLPGHEVELVSDLQRTALGARVSVPRGVRVLALAAPAQLVANRGIGAVAVSEGAVTVDIVGTPGTAAGDVTVRLGGRVVGRGLAGPGTAVSLPLAPLGPGWWTGEVLLPPDEFREDDRRLFVARVAPLGPVVVAPDAGPFVSTALAVLEGGRPGAAGEPGRSVWFGGIPRAGATIVLPPEDVARVGELNRALAAHGGEWRYAGPGTPGPLVAKTLPGVAGIAVARRLRLEPVGAPGAADTAVLATVNGEPWLVRDGDAVLLGSRLDTAWTALPASAGFVPFVDALVARVVHGEGVITSAEGPVGVVFTTRGADTIGATVEGPDPRESDLTPASPDEARAVLGAAVLTDAELGAARFSDARRADATGALLVVALLVALAEFAVASLSS